MTTLTTTPDLTARAAWAILTEPGDAVAGVLTQAIGHEVAFDTITGSRSQAVEALIAHDATDSVEDAEAAIARWLPRLRQSGIDAAITDSERHGISMVDPTGVPGMSDLGSNAPHLLWVRGNPAALHSPLTDKITLTGTRTESSYGSRVATDLATDLVQRGVTIVSGAAFGVDGVAHSAALAPGGTTIAWLACGVDRPYPTAHRDLLDRIATGESGAVVSELAPTTSPTKWRFQSRCRLIAALSAATVIVEAGARSGSLRTGICAAELGRSLGIVPGSIYSVASSGCHRLAREYDAQLVTNAQDASELLGR